MAQVITHYTGTVQGDATIYYYANPDSTSTPTRIYNGTQVNMPADYADWVTNNMYRIIWPGGGWMFRWNIGGITPVYTTVTDPCTPPSSVTLNTATKKLTINGGAGGDLNTLVGWGVSWRDQQMGTSTWGAWTSDVVHTVRTVDVLAPAGYSRQFRVRTRGSAGASYYSAYTLCATILDGNSAPNAPSIPRPVNGAVTRSTTPSVVLTCPADPEGDAMTLKRQIDGGTWQNVSAVVGTGGTVRDRLPALSVGAHTLRYTLTDVHGLVSPMATVGFTVTPVTWSRAIATGTIIASPTLSHRADIQELRTVINEQRAYYGLAMMTLPGTVGQYASWKAQMQAMQAAIHDALTVAGVAAPVWQSVSSWPTAAVVNQIRAAAVLA